MVKSYRMAPTPVGASVRKLRARKRAKGAPTHVRSWPLRPTGTQCREIGIRFLTGVRVYNAVLGEFLTRGRAVKADPAWETARGLPHGSPAERQVRRVAFRPVEADPMVSASVSIGGHRRLHDPRCHPHPCRA